MIPAGLSVLLPTCTTPLHVCGICIGDIWPDTWVIFFWVFCALLGHVLHFFILVTYLFKTFTHQIISVHPEDAPEISHFSQDNYPDTRLFFFVGFPHIPGICAAFLHVCDIFIQDIYPLNY